MSEKQAEILLKFLLTTQMHMIRLHQLKQKENQNDEDQRVVRR